MVDLSPLPPRTRLVLHAAPADAAPAMAALGLALPPMLRAAEAGAVAALRLAPDEILVTAPDATALADTLAPALAGRPHSLVDLSDGFAGVALHGPAAARLLSAGCPLDLRAEGFPPGMASRTLLARAPITLWRRGAELWQVETPRSFAAYLRDFLAESRRGLPPF